MKRMLPRTIGGLGGFTLLEVLLALTVLAGFSTVIAGLLSSAVRTLDDETPFRDLPTLSRFADQAIESPEAVSWERFPSSCVLLMPAADGDRRVSVTLLSSRHEEERNVAWLTFETDEGYVLRQVVLDAERTEKDPS